MRQLLYFSSSTRATGTPGDFTLVLGNRVLSSSIGVTTRVMVSEASIPRTWFSIRQGANSFKIQPTNYTVSLPIGYINAIDLRNALQSALPAGWTVTYSRITNKLTFSRPNDAVDTYFFDLTGFSRGVLGFTGNTVPFYNNSATSSLPIRVNSDSAVLIHTDLQKKGLCALDNLTDGAFTESTVLAKLPVNCAPFDNVTFTHEGDLNWQEVVSTHVDTLRIWLTDDAGTPLDLPHDWSFSLVVDHSHNESDTTLGDIRDILKLMALSDKNILG